MAPSPRRRVRAPAARPLGFPAAPSGADVPDHPLGRTIPGEPDWRSDRVRLSHSTCRRVNSRRSRADGPSQPGARAYSCTYTKEPITTANAEDTPRPSVRSERAPRRRHRGNPPRELRRLQVGGSPRADGTHPAPAAASRVSARARVPRTRRRARRAQFGDHGRPGAPLALRDRDG